MSADYSLVYINFSLKRNFWRTCIDMALELGFMGLSTIVTAIEEIWEICALHGVCLRVV